MGAVVVLAVVSALNPTELAAVAVMLLLPSPERLLFGYWLGAMLTGVAAGSMIVFALGARAPSTRPGTRSAPSCGSWSRCCW
jgi:Sap, sulfolipid-1-addressing protein